MIRSSLEKSSIYFIVIFCLFSGSWDLFAQPKREVRAVWITTNHQLDWPPKTYNPEIQKKSLIEILDNLKSKNFNTIYFQVRSQGTVFYKSKYEPWSQYLTGKLGQFPNYDPLQFVIEEAHKRNLEVHAWLNVLKIKSGDGPLQFTELSHIALMRPDWVRKYKEQNSFSYWLDPGLPDVRDYLKNLCIEIVENYDVDGIHLDYIRYPGIDFDDSLSYQIFGMNKSLADFRRENINQLVSEIYDTLTTIKPTLKIGSAPIGIYENLSDARGLEGKNSLFQDAREWLKRKKHDYIVPQIYWHTNTNPKFVSLVRDWMRNSSGRHVIIGIGAYNPSVAKEIENQIEITRSLNSAGQSFFRYEHIKDKNFLAYKYPAIIPPMKWKDSIPPEPPFSLSGKNLPGKLGLVELVWGIPPKANDGDTAKFYSVYRSENRNISIENASHLLTITKNYYLYDFIRRPSKLEYLYQVTSLDKNYNESLTGTNIIKVELKNLKNILQNAYAKQKTSLTYDKELARLLIETNNKTSVKIILRNESGEKLQDVYSGSLAVGLNFFEFKLPSTRIKKFVIFIDFENQPDEVIRFTI